MGLQTRADGLWPRWDVDALVAGLADLQSRSNWPQWRSIRVPTVVILGEHGMFSPTHGQENVKELASAALVTVPDVGHHDLPDVLRENLPMEPEPIEEARRASDFTMDCETASVAWSAATSWQGWRRQGLGAIGDVMSELMSGDGRGVVDFRTGGCLLTGSKLGLGLELYFGPGLTMVRRRHGSRWHNTRERSARGSAAYTPVWVVELPRGVTEAAVSEGETVDGARCRCLTVRCDPQLAAERSRHGMQIPDHPSVPAELWIDSSGCLRRIRVTEVFREGESHEAGLVTELRLSDLGTATAPVPPQRTAA